MEKQALSFLEFYKKYFKREEEASPHVLKLVEIFSEMRTDSNFVVTGNRVPYLSKAIKSFEIAQALNQGKTVAVAVAVKWDTRYLYSLKAELRRRFNIHISFTKSKDSDYLYLLTSNKKPRK
jgi:hypothetical protein